MPASKPLALTPCCPIELLTFALRQTSPTTLIICTSRNDFLSAILKGTRPPSPALAIIGDHHFDDHLPSQSSLADDALPPSSSQLHPYPPSKHPLLIPTLHQRSRSQHISLAFMPTISHLRAHLSILAARPSPTSPQPGDLLLVYGLVGLHRGTSEWSTQGLGNTLAGLVEAGARTGWRVVLVEEQQEEEEEEEEKKEERKGEDEDEEGKREVDEDEEEEGVQDGEDGRDEDHGSAEPNIEEDEERAARAARAEQLRRRQREGIWHERLPILSGSVRRRGAEMEYAGRTVEVGTVLRRWCTFGRGEWEDESPA